MFFKETLPFLHKNIQSFAFIFLVVFMEREKENKHPRDEMLVVDTFWKVRTVEGNNVVYLQREGKIDIMLT